MISPLNGIHTITDDLVQPAVDRGSIPAARNGSNDARGNAIVKITESPALLEAAQHLVTEAAQYGQFLTIILQPPASNTRCCNEAIVPIARAGLLCGRSKAEGGHIQCRSLLLQITYVFHGRLEFAIHSLLHFTVLNLRSRETLPFRLRHVCQKAGAQTVVVFVVFSHVGLMLRSAGQGPLRCGSALKILDHPLRVAPKLLKFIEKQKVLGSVDPVFVSQNLENVSRLLGLLVFNR